ncbi:MAG: histidinol dehydrogenase, partial [Spirochaetota bacterium]
SGVSVADFETRTGVVHVSERGYEDLAPHVIALAEYEGFHWHAHALLQRPGSGRATR